MITSSEIESGDLLSLSASEWLLLDQISNNSPRFLELIIEDAVATRSEVTSLVALIRSMPDDGFEHVHITAADVQDTTEPNISISGTGVLHFDLPLKLARAWFAIASETIDVLGDPEALYVIGETTEELRQAAKKLRRENWRPDA